jgi:hypothetical protein
LAADHPRWIADDGGACRNVARHDAAGTDYRIVADGDPRKNHRSPANPDVPTDADGPPELQAAAPLRRIARVVGGVDLDRRSDLRPLADRDLHHVEDHAVEVEEGVGPQADVEAVIAVERRTDNGTGPDFGEALGEQHAPLVIGENERGVVSGEPSPRRSLIELDLRCGGTIEFAGQHPVFFAPSHLPFPSPEMVEYRSGDPLGKEGLNESVAGRQRSDRSRPCPSTAPGRASHDHIGHLNER